ncbi:hypothetical protein MICAH_4080008 [Microcystis aeruginosa PCC 9809]|uniref:Uncharacterized protein n=1 Tax=Microcystis aeruginosa PCC 9809 TaxID=1160285 RepID=I4HXE5_MICAE|nr:hypothetical protein MICAH_4080008 [Microcystis aeruginosa PCC 9809]
MISDQLSVISYQLSVHFLLFTDITFWAHAMRLYHIKTD